MPADHLDRAKDYIAKGDDYYARAADEILAAKADDPQLSNYEIGKRVGKDESWVRKLVQSRTNASPGDDFIVDWQSGPKDQPAAARRVLRDPEQRRQVFADLGEAELDEVEQDASEILVKRSRAARAEHEDGVTPGSESVSPDEFSKHWADGPLLSLVRKVRSLKGLVAQQGLILGSLSNEEALDIANEAEAGIAEIRAALQERVRDEEMVSNG